jgi:hypothetical protein
VRPKARPSKKLNRRTRHIFIEILIFAVLAGVSAVLFSPVQKRLIREITAMRDFYIALAEEKFDKKFYYESMGPSIFGTLDLRNISVYEKDAPENFENALLSVRRIRIKYSLLDMLNNAPQKAVYSVVVDKPMLTINIQDDSAKLLWSGIQKESRNETDAQGGSSLPGSDENLITKIQEFLSELPEGFNVRFNKGSVRIAASENTVSLQSFSFNSYKREGHLVLKADWKAEANIKGAGNEFFAVSLPGKADGSFSLETVRGEFNILLPDTLTDLFEMKKARFSTVLTGDYITVRKIIDDNPYDVFFTAWFDGRELSTKLNIDNFSFSNILTLRGKLSQYNPWLSTKLKGTALFEKTNEKGIGYSANLKGRLHGKSPVGGGSFELDAGGNESSIRIRNMMLNISRGIISYSGSFAFNPVAPNGVLRVEEFYFGENGSSGTSSPVSGEFTLTSNAQRISIFAGEIKIENTILNALDIEVLRGKNNYPISLSAIRFNNIESYEDVSVSRISAEAAFDVLKNNFSARGRFDSLALNDLLGIAGTVLEFPQQNDMVRGVSENISITTEFSFETDFKNMSYTIPHLVVAYHGFSDIIAVSSISGSDHAFELTECHITAGDGIDVTAKADYTDLNNIIFSAETIANNIPYQFNGSLRNKKNLAVTGSYNLLVNALINTDGSLEGSCSIDSLVIPTISKTATLSLDSMFNIVSNGDWNVEINSLDINDLIYSIDVSHIYAKGSINQDRIYFPELLLDDGRDPIRGAARFYFKETDVQGGPDAGAELAFNLSNASGTERLVIEGGFQNDAFDGRLTADNFRLSRFFQYSSNMIVNGIVEYSFETDGTYNVIFNLASLTGRFERNDFFITTRGSLTPQGIEVGETFASFAEWTARVPFISFDRESARLETITSIQGGADEDALSADLDIKCDFTKIDSWADISNILKEFSGSVNFTNAHLFDPEMPQQFGMEFSRLENIIAISGGPEDMLDSQIDLTGAFYLNLSAPSPVIGTIGGMLTNSNIYADTSNLYVDLKKLWIYLPDEIHTVECTAGFALADIHISGNILDPGMYGIARGYGVKMAVPDFLSVEIGPTPVTLHLRDSEMSFEPVLTSVGTGEAFVTGSFYFDRWVISDYNLNIEASVNKPVPYAVDVVGISASGLASGTISLTLNDASNLSITGNITGSNSTITMDMLSPEEQQAAIDALAGNGDVIVQTDLTIRADKKVEFLWPNKDNPVLRATADAGDSFRITGDTLSGKSSMVGNIGLRGGELFYFQRSFYIREGELVFRENEINFDPHISVVAETRDLSDEGQVTISIIIDNQSLLSFTPVIQSSPPLSQVEILSILGNTMTGSVDEETDRYIRPFLASTTDVIAQFLLIRRVETRLRDLLHVDMFSARTQALQNAIFATMFTPEEREGQTTSAWNYFDNTTLFVGKYITQNMFVQSMVSTVYDRNQIENNGLSFNVFLGIELSSPLFDIRAEMSPDILNTQDLWIPATSISLRRTWRLP